MSFVALPMICAVASVMAAALMAWRLGRARTTIHQLARELEQARCHESLGTLTGGIAHDFNNILGAIMGFSALLEDDLISMPDSRTLAQQITIAARRGQSIVRQLMSYSKRNIADKTQDVIPVSFDPLIRENISILKSSLNSAHRLVYNNLAKDDCVVANPTQLGQALLNLCINADHAIGVKTGVIEITLGNEMIGKPLGNGGISVSGGTRANEPVTLINGRLEPGNYVCVSVKDDGCGMTREVANRIFDPFFTTKDINVGTGLGLPAIQGIVHSHGGAITMTSTHFHGTTFSLFFPVGTVAPVPATPTVEKALQ